MIRIHGIGRLTDAPEIRYNNEGKPSVATYTLATDRRSKDGKETDFLKCVTFGYNAEFAERFLKKGTKIFVEGYIKTGKYERDNVTRYTTDLVIESHEFCERKEDDSIDARDEAVKQDVEAFDQAALPFK